MHIKSHLEVHFDAKRQASIHVDDRSSPDDRVLGELLLLSSFILRQLVNLGPKHSAASQITILLSEMAGAAFNRTVAEQGKNTTYPPVLNEQKRRCVADLTLTDDNYTFIHHAHGFGIFARDIGTYIPLGILTLAQYLFAQHPHDEDFGFRLDMVFGLCSAMFSSGQVTVASQYWFARRVAAEALAVPRPA